MKRMVASMRMTLAAPLIFAAAAFSPLAAQNWPSETGLPRDGFRGSIETLDRYLGNQAGGVQGEELRGRVGGWAGAVRNWFDRQGEKVGQNESDSARYFNLRREWENDVGRRR